MNRITSKTVLLGISAFLCIGNASHAANTFTFLSADTTVNSNINTNYTIIGYSNLSDFSANPRRNPTSPTINLQSGGTPYGYIDTYNHSVLNMTGGNNGGVAIADKSTFNFAGGFCYEMLVVNSSVTNMNGGNVGFANARNSSSVTMNSGSIGGYLQASDTSSFTLNGGSIGGVLTAFNNSAISINGGSVGQIISSVDNSTLDMAGGNVGSSVQVNDSCVFNLRGGSIGAGNLSDGIYIFASGTVNIFGAGLTDTLISSNNPPYYSSFSHYTLSGTLSDGTDLAGTNLYIANGGGGRVIFNGRIAITSVPEPGSVPLFVGMGAIGVSILRKRRKG